MPAQSLRPQTESALRRTAASCVERNIGVQQKWNVVAPYVQITAIDVCYVGQGIQIFDLRTIRRVHHRPVLSIRDALNLLEWFALGILNHRVIEFLAAHEING